MSRQSLRRRLLDDRGASPVEFVLVGTLLTALTLAVLQLAVAVYVRNVVHDAAVEGAYHAALADVDLADGVAVTRNAIGRAIGPEYAEDIAASHEASGETVTVRVRVTTTLPVFGLLGVPEGLRVEASAPAETLGEP